MRDVLATIAHIPAPALQVSDFSSFLAGITHILGVFIHTWVYNQYFDHLWPIGSILGKATCFNCSQGGSCLIKSWVSIIQGRKYYTSGSWSWLYCWTSFRCNLRLLPLKLRSSPCLDLGCTTNWISGTHFLHSSWFFVKIFVQVVVEQVILPELAKVKYSKFLLKRFHGKCIISISPQYFTQ